MKLFETNLDNSPFFVHTNVFKIKNLLIHNNKAKDFNSYADSVTDALYRFFGEDFILPSFNNEFKEKKIFNVNKDKAQSEWVGAYPEFLRVKKGISRSHVPFFSTISKKIFLKKEIEIKPYGKNSIFEKLLKMNGSIIQFGCDFANGLTFLHYIEQFSAPPLYRYDKTFFGKIISEVDEYDCSVTFHVIPKGVKLVYDWGKVYNDFIDNDLIEVSKYNSNVRIMNCKKIAEYAIDKIKLDPYYLLDDESQIIAKNISDNGNTRVELSDYE